MIPQHSYKTATIHQNYPPLPQIFPQTAVQRKKATQGGALDFQMPFQGNCTVAAVIQIHRKICLAVPLPTHLVHPTNIKGYRIYSIKERDQRFQLPILKVSHKRHLPVKVTMSNLHVIHHSSLFIRSNGKQSRESFL